MTLNDLRSYKKLKSETERTFEELKRIEDRLYSAKAPKLDGMPKGSSGGDMTDLIIKYLDLQEQFNNKMVKQMDIFAEIEGAILSLPANEREVIHLRYIDGLTISETATISNYSESQVKRLQRQGQEKLLKDEPK